MKAAPQARQGGEDPLWQLLLATRDLERRSGPVGLGLDARGRAPDLPAHDPAVVLARGADGRWGRRRAPLPPGPTGTLLDLYLPLCGAGPRRTLVVAHLGQSLDGRIATESGESVWVTGPEDLAHTHRLRALCDAVVVGAETVRCDDPRLTTRRVPGPSPTRVVLDPRRRLPGRPLHLLADGAAPTLLVCAQALAAPGDRAGGAEVIGVPAPDGRLDLAAVLARLRERGLRTILVEGGGVTVSAFLEANLLDRLQITVAPLLLGSGRHAIGLPPVSGLDRALRPAWRWYPLGEDVLFDLALR